MRKINVQGKIWQYRVEYTTVTIGFPNSKLRFTIEHTTLMGLTRKELEGTGEERIKILPVNVKNYIEKNLSKLAARRAERKRK